MCLLFTVPPELHHNRGKDQTFFDIRDLTRVNIEVVRSQTTTATSAISGARPIHLTRPRSPFTAVQWTTGNKPREAETGDNIPEAVEVHDAC